MRQHIVILACLCTALVYALPIADNNSDSSNNEGLQLVQIPLSENKELDILSLDSDGRLSERSKRTIGILRDLFPELTKQVEDKVNQIVGQVIRVLGPTVLRTAIQGNANRARENFDADFDDDDDDDDSSSSSSRVQIDLPSFDPDEDKDDEKKDNSTTNNLNNGDNSIDLNALTEQLQETIRVARQAAEANDNLISNSDVYEGDQSAAESKAPAIDELTLDDDNADLDDRNKRFLALGFGGAAQGSASSSSGGGGAGGGGAGSGNFLFDIIRKTADRATKVAGAAYRFMTAGVPNLINNNQTLDEIDVNEDQNSEGSNTVLRMTRTKRGRYRSTSKDRYSRTLLKPPGLFTGSIQTPQGDERANEASSSGEDSSGGSVGGSVSVSAGTDGYTEGIPGPVTRLVVLANRGLANLIQDLILRVAATSERLVNFKARLITSLI